MREAPSDLEKNGSSNASPSGAVRVAIIVALGLLLLPLVANTLLLVFAGILLALLLRGLIESSHKQSGLPMGWSLAAVVFAILAIVRQSIADELQPGNGAIAARPVAGRSSVSRPPPSASSSRSWSSSSSASMALPILESISPAPFASFRSSGARIREVLHEMGRALRWWLIRRLISMAVIAVMTGAELWLIGVRLAFTLGLLAGTLSFVPFLGSISSAIPAILIALTQSTTMVLYVIVLYVVVHVTEGYILVPLILIQKRWFIFRLRLPYRCKPSSARSRGSSVLRWRRGSWPPSWRRRACSMSRMSCTIRGPAMRKR
jgi:AI-2E family transporter